MLRWTLDRLLVNNTCLVFLGVTTLALLSLADQLNAHTVPLRTWTGLVLGVLAASLSSVGFLGSRFLMQTETFPAFKAYLHTRQKVDPAFKPMVKSMLSTDPHQEQYTRLRSLAALRLLFSVGVAIVFVHAAVQAIFLLSWIRDTPGLESSIDAGFARSQPPTYVQQQKLVMLQWIQTGFVHVVCTGAAYIMTRCHFPRHEGL